MKTLTINDLPMTEELDREAMSEVRGGMYMGFAPYYWGGYVDASTTDMSFSAAQLINQGQSVATNVGNNVAVLGGFANPSVPVTATQNASINNNVRF
ncbi:hypothetical protein [Aromatoleum petrolei]|uniref:Uncharacterized protein n=1 Tax=Aromatoleum petrolei TaxID=76116 RepID=A0ABX1MSH1_9RHOO|nr:hypothetical protein [Aromatoleum petrolei]NMF90923.1 hypothetical protein [Aromatoleum petrolei]QTQ35095.1 Uncharacterized protein ToN1_09230 [Aromatoleum petrolei]